MNSAALKVLHKCPVWQAAYEVQRDAVLWFHQACADVLGDACALQPLHDEMLSVRRNLFSTLFVMVNTSLGLPADKLKFYAVVTHCLRALVTGCDNILDNEYKAVIPFDLPGKGFRFRSVLTIMTADAVLMRLIANEMDAGNIDKAQATCLPNSVLSVLIPSGVQEHKEESGIGDTVPTPDEMLSRVHFQKTGLLFEAPIRIVERMGDAEAEATTPLAEGLGQFGIGCQILDDLKDVAEDLSMRKHNMLVSVAYHGSNEKERELVVEAMRCEQGATQAAHRAAASLDEAAIRSNSLATACFANAYQKLSKAAPDFGLPEAAALGQLVQESIMSLPR